MRQNNNDVTLTATIHSIRNTQSNSCVELGKRWKRTWRHSMLYCGHPGFGSVLEHKVGFGLERTCECHKTARKIMRKNISFLNILSVNYALNICCKCLLNWDMVLIIFAPHYLLTWTSSEEESSLSGFGSVCHDHVSKLYLKVWLSCN